MDAYDEIYARFYELAKTVWRLCGLVDCWENVARHSQLAGVAALHICKLLHLPQKTVETAIGFVIIHDFDKRIDKEETATGVTQTLTSSTFLVYDVEIVIRQEAGRPGFCELLEMTCGTSIHGESLNIFSGMLTPAWE